MASSLGQLQDAITKQFGVSGGSFEQAPDLGGMILYADSAVLNQVKSWFNGVKEQYPNVTVNAIAGADGVLFKDMTLVVRVNPNAPAPIAPSASGTPSTLPGTDAGTPGGGDAALAKAAGGSPAGESVRRNMSPVVEAILKTRSTGEVRRIIESRLKVTRQGGRTVVEGQGGVRRLTQEGRARLRRRMAFLSRRNGSR